VRSGRSSDLGGRMVGVMGRELGIENGGREMEGGIVDRCGGDLM
jgi:hypothetical protein